MSIARTKYLKKQTKYHLRILKIIWTKKKLVAFWKIKISIRLHSQQTLPLFSLKVSWINCPIIIIRLLLKLQNKNWKNKIYCQKIHHNLNFNTIKILWMENKSFNRPFWLKNFRKVCNRSIWIKVLSSR